MELIIKKHHDTLQQMIEIWESKNGVKLHLMCLCNEDHFYDLEVSEELYDGEEIILDVRRG